MRRFAFESLFEGNKLVIACVFFTIFVVINAIIQAILGVELNLNLAFVFASFIVITANLLPIWFFQKLEEKGWISLQSYYFWSGYPMHYFISTGLLTIALGIYHAFNPITITFFLSNLAFCTVVYVAFALGSAVFYQIQIIIANRNLRKIIKSRGEK